MSFEQKVTIWMKSDDKAQLLKKAQEKKLALGSFLRTYIFEKIKEEETQKV